MAEKVNKSYASFHYHSLINLCVYILSVISPSPEKDGNLAVYDFITQYAIYFMGYCRFLLVMSECLKVHFVAFRFICHVNLSEKGGSLAVYDFITQYAICFMG